MTRRRCFVSLAGILVVAAALVPGALAGKPTFERITVDETFADDFLTDACGVPVTTHASGHVTVRTFSGGGTGPADITTLNIGLTATSGDNTYRFRDVGADHVQIAPDGTEIVMIIGQIPFGFTGVLKIDLATGEVIHEPQHSLEGRVEDACAALTA
ncbi:MAG TPA: hypothetical protein VFL61_04660 [Gaiellaceae bacterium]|nr:hypothetical protein [Gaiellaceae bacterium]